MKKKSLLTALVLGAMTVPSVFAVDSYKPTADTNVTTTVTANGDGTFTAKSKTAPVLGGIDRIYVGDHGFDNITHFRNTSIEPDHINISEFPDVNAKDSKYMDLTVKHLKLRQYMDGNELESGLDLDGVYSNHKNEGTYFHLKHDEFRMDLDTDRDGYSNEGITMTVENGLFQGTIDEYTGSRLTKEKLTISKINGEEEYDDYGNNITKKFTADYDLNGMTVANEHGNIKFTTSGINAGNQKIEGVAAGVADTDAVNVKQLNDKIGALKDNDTITNVTAGPNITVVKSATPGQNGMPAEPTFNVSLTPDVAINSANFSGSSTNIETDITATGVTVKDTNGSGSSMNNRGFNVFEGNTYSAMQNDHIHFGDTSKNESADYSLKGIYLADNDSDPINITKENISFGSRQLHDVAAGKADTDAVNVKQLKDSIAAATSNIVDNDTITTVKAGDNIAVTANGHDYTVSLDQATKDKINSIDGLKSDVVKAKTTVTAGTGVTVNETTNANGSTNYEVSVDKALADQVAANKNGIDGLNGRVGKNADAIQANKDAIRDLQVGLTAAGTDVTGKGPIKVRRSMVLNGGSTFEVSLDQSTTDQIKANKDGIDGLNAKVADNANGIKANADAIKANKDNIAINKAAIDELAAHIDNGGNNMNALNSKINDVQKESRQGIASASALAALHPLDYNPDHKVDVMAGLGHYRGKTAAAIGAAYRPNENVMFTIGTSINGKDSAINAGVSYKVGAKDSTYRSQAAMAKDIDDLKAMVNKLHEENSELKAVIYNMQGK